MAPRITSELLYVYADDARTERSVINEAFLQSDGIQYVSIVLSIEEQAAASRFARLMNDGEAQALAVAAHRTVAILSDDIAVTKAAPYVGVTLETTLDLLAAWQATGTSIEALSTAARRMRARASYFVPRQHPLREWYANLVDREMA